MKPKRVRIVLDPTMPLGKYRVGGVRVIAPASSDEFLAELNTVEVTCATEVEAHTARMIVENDPDLELAE